jgi:hypothetical protein
MARFESREAYEAWKSGHAQEADPVPLTNVRVVDVQMTFGSRVVFMVKWALASIPALLILVILGVLGAGLLAGLFRVEMPH